MWSLGTPSAEDMWCLSGGKDHHLCRVPCRFVATALLLLWRVLAPRGFRFVRSQVLVSCKWRGFALRCRDLRVCTIGLLAEVLSEGTRYRALVIVLPEVFL